jgi:FAD/FMN-containing dehydrogenase
MTTSETTPTTYRAAPAAAAELAARLDGEVLTEGHPAYDSARRVWNGMIDKRPTLIVRCASTADVAAALEFAREQRLELAVRGGGHNVAGTAVAEGGIVVDLSRMRDVRVDHSRRSVTVQGGATWADVDRATQPFGLATPGGVVSETGVAGLALNGGVSSQRRRDGMTIDNLLSAEVVVADGRLVHASADENADLFWALRGGGGNFGVVTSFEFRLHELGPNVFNQSTAYPIERTRSVLRAYRDTVAEAPDELTADAVVWSLPAMPELPEHLRGLPYVGIESMHAGAPAEGVRVSAPLRALDVPLLDMSDTVKYVDLQRSLDPLFPAGLRYYWKALYLEELTDQAIDAIASWSEERPSPRTIVVVRHLGGAIGRATAEETAFGDRDAEFMLSIDSTWSDPTDDERNIAWTRAFWEDMRRFARGKAYFNFPGLLEEGDSGVRESYGANYDRLAQVKARYDPDNLFRLNQNIRPAREGEPR